MSDLSEVISEGAKGINLNQNIWILVVCMTAIGFGEYYPLATLYYFGLCIGIPTAISILFCLLAYTINYWKKKMK